MTAAFKVSGLPPMERLVAFMLADHHNATTGRCDPSIGLLVKETGLCRRSVIGAIQRIEAAGHLTVSKVRSSNGKIINSYKLHPCSTCTRAAHAPVQEIPFTGAGDAPHGVQEMHPNHNRIRREPEVEVKLPDFEEPEAKPPGHKGPKGQTAATRILAHLNTTAGRAFRETPQNLKLIQARLREAEVTEEGVVKMISRMVTKWRGTEQEEYLRPETLFGQKKFGGYYDLRDTPATNGTAKPERTIQW